MMHMTRRALAAIAFALMLAVTTAPLRAEVRLASLFGDHMVLQRDKSVAVWGWSGAGDKVTATIAGQSAEATAGKDGAWSLSLKAMQAGGPHELTVKSSDGSSVKVSDVLVGEVWLCSGQSNMAMKVNGVVNAEAEMAAAELPRIRMFTVGRSGTAEPQTECKGSWAVASPKTVGGFSATAFFFGRKLYETLDVPIGLINSSVGGTPIEAWTSLDAQQRVPALEPIAGKPGSGAQPNANQNRPAVLYNGMIAPLAPYTLRGAIWYQGERNARGMSHLYGVQLTTLISDWRTRWRDDFPVYFVQLPNFHAPQTAPVETTGWVTVRDGMFHTLRTVPNTGMAVTIDVGEEKNIHPKNKQAAGQRLAMFALAQTYHKDSVASGPIYKSMKIAGGKIVLTFDHVAGGLSSRGGGELTGFTIAASDKKFVAASAKIVGDTIEVWSDEVAKPVAVRYAWADNPKCNLVNKADLPASPFRTDEWSLE